MLIFTLPRVSGQVAVVLMLQSLGFGVLGFGVERSGFSGWRIWGSFRGDLAGEDAEITAKQQSGIMWGALGD